MADDIPAEALEAAAHDPEIGRTKSGYIHPLIHLNADGLCGCCEVPLDECEYRLVYPVLNAATAAFDKAVRCAGAHQFALKQALAAAAPHLIEAGRRQAADELAAAHAKIDRLIWGQTYEPDGRCRRCRARPGPDWKPGQPTDPGNTHRMNCPLYVGPLVHEWIRLPRLNGTFGGFDHDCACGGWFRQGGRAGHGDGSENAVPVCPNADQPWRGPQPEAADHRIAEGGTQ